MTQIIIQPDAAAGIDNGLSESVPTLNQGTTNFLAIRTTLGGRQRPILKFDLSPLVGFPIGRAEMWLYTTSVSPATPPTWTVYRIHANNAGWTEAGSTWNTIDGAASWKGDAAADGGPDAGCSVAGTDYETPAIGSVVVPASTPADTLIAIPLDLAQLATMIGGVDHGFVIDGDNSAGASVRSSDYGVANLRPAIVAWSPEPDDEDDQSIAIHLAAEWSPEHRFYE